MRQAVVLIHGIGEQLPMATLRGFVDAVAVSFDEANASPIYSKPDRIAEILELRRLVAEKTRRRPTTDFYEFYWAHLMEGTTLRHLWPWLRAVLVRDPRVVPKSLRVLWGASWALLLAALVIFVLTRGRPEAEASTWGMVTSLVLAGLFLLVQGAAIDTLGDAARYLSPRPSNIAVRQHIRSQGIQLLRRLHDSGRYDRIVLVGHSLGSVIGYDIITHLWEQCTLPDPLPDRAPQPQLAALERAGKAVAQDDSHATLEAFREAQHALWVEQRHLQYPWLVTDFVTLGSPLAHAEFLLAADRADLEGRQRQRELPTCPPVPDAGRYSYGHEYRFQDQPRTLRRLHHAAPFAVTRWTNIYYPIRFGLLGDWVGGPLRAVFGNGVRDVALTGGRYRLLPLLPHVHYWRDRRPQPTDERRHAVPALRRALRLESSKWLAAVRGIGATG